jgi:ABC-type transport system substrate-binding protein
LWCVKEGTRMQGPAKSCCTLNKLRTRLKRYACVVLFLFFCGCSKTGQEGRVPTGVLRLALSEDPLTLDPAIITDVGAGALSAKLFDGLVRFDLRGNIVPCLAESWEISLDGKQYQFTLREGVRFHNGRLMTSADVRWSFQHLLDPETISPRRWVLERIAGAKDYSGPAGSIDLVGIQTPDARIVRILLEEPFAPFLALLAMPNAVILPAEEVQRWGDAFGQHPVGTGPFILEKWVRDKELFLTKNPEYFAGPPLVSGVQYRVIPEAWATVSEFSRGRLDWIAIPEGHMEEFLTDPSMRERLKHSEGLNTYYLGFHCGRAPLDNPKVRRALAMAIDRGKMVATLMKQRAILAVNPIPPALDPALGEVAPIPYDPAAAKRFLEEEGITNLHLRLYQASSLETQEKMEVVQHYLSQIGVQVELVQREWSSFKEAVVEGEADMFFLSWWADYPDPENFLFPNFFSDNGGAGGNKTRFSDETLDEWILQANKETDPIQRKELYRRCAHRIVDLSPWVFLWHRSEWVVTQPWVKNLELANVYNAEKFTHIVLEN